MSIVKRIEKLEMVSKTENYDGWRMDLIIGAGATITQATNLETGEVSTDPDLIEALHKRSLERCRKGIFEKFEVVFGEPAKPFEEEAFQKGYVLTKENNGAES
jgi:hypothetical protein